ncbi:MAG: aminotransferase [Ruminococcaceae bacterium]|nr:aminotransferase [Oscillospiraceae bacterium]
MLNLKKATTEELSARLSELRALYEEYKSRDLRLDMSRGKPGSEQLDLTLPMFESLSAKDTYLTQTGFDTRNYGLLDGIPEAKLLFAELLDVSPDNVIVCGNSSLNLMFDYISTAYAKGLCGSTPWSKLEGVKFLCPAPGYDRHFGITEYFGIENIVIPMTENGPDMDLVEDYVKDPLVKGIWCVPMYSNPDGITYSDETVRRFAALKPAAEDFRVMWDNAYCVHHLTDTPDTLLNIFDEAKTHNSEDLFIELMSTSKISFPGAGVAVLAASARNVADIKSRMTVQTIGFDKLNMLRHVRFFKNADGVNAHMKLHAALLRPRFELVLSMLERELGGRGIAQWHTPNGGYFVSVNVCEGCAKRTVRLLAEAGVVLTGAGATYPYGNDPADSNIRLAPTFPPVEELQVAMELFCICAEIAAIEALI